MSNLSPGPVADGEYLHFLVSDPEGLLGGFVNPQLLRQLDTNGLSVLREGARTAEFEQTLAELEARWSAKARSFVGVSTFTASAVRCDATERLSCVLDTGLEGKPHHADIVGVPISADSRNMAERLRKLRAKKISDQIGKRFESATEFRSGALARFAGR